MPERLEAGPVLPVEIRVDVQGLRPDIIDEKGDTVIEGNLEDPQILANAREAVTKARWYKSLLEDVKANKKTVLVVTTLGGISLFVAKFEFWVRGGKDIRGLIELFEKRRTQKSETQK